MSRRGLSPECLARFKGELTDENTLIAQEVRRLLPPPGRGFVLDVGAGVGDVAAAAFPERAAELLDLLEFGPSANPLHRRLRVDFFEYQAPRDLPVDLMLMSHVLQYLDDDCDKLAAKTEEIGARAIITVLNDPFPLQDEILEWFVGHEIQHNAETPVHPCPNGRYVLAGEGHVIGTVACGNYLELASQMARVIYDCIISDRQVEQFAAWLETRAVRPAISIPQTIRLFTTEENKSA